MVKAREVKTAHEARAIVEERGLSHVKVGLFDTDGVMRGKYMSRAKFLSSLEKGFSFCDVVLGWDVKDQLYDNTRYTGWHTGYPDAPVRILPESCRDVPFEDDMLLFLAEFDGRAQALCPRAVLRRVIERCRSLGFDPYAALEYEFFLFDETPESVRSKGFRNLKPFTPDVFGYSILRNSVHGELYREILELSERMDFPLEGLHTETGPGVLEAAIAVDGVEAAGDKAALFKTFIKVLAQRMGLMATFMSRWSSEYPGQSGHIHLSLRNSGSGDSAFFDSGQPDGISQVMRQFIAGQQRLMPQFLALMAPTVNSYRRLVPGYWAPTGASWGVENRTTALRAIPGGDTSQRIEYRLGAADANPYLALAAALGSGLYGVMQQWHPGEPVTGNAYSLELEGEQVLPGTLWESTQQFKASEAAQELFGSDFVEHFSASREWEEREYRRHVSDWELERYFEII
ncbi:glutamine synthetase [Microbulbifer sp. VAAF005]|uniref:glutamine synthetase family protein n=1 Tax=Microbulbifer sp. VAAF005 TaxID=3034230 RepID=UPI0024AC8691|nr:glutamine synthetase [Microbulbifer sp. VAAF005]WHI45764.1 glutamine synthetase [Microbulbifer sp. VAAF005]